MPYFGITKVLDDGMDLLCVLSSEKMDFYQNVHILKKVNKIYPLPAKILGTMIDRPHYDRICIITKCTITRHVITRADYKCIVSTCISHLRTEAAMSLSLCYYPSDTSECSSSLVPDQRVWRDDGCDEAHRHAGHDSPGSHATGGSTV